MSYSPANASGVSSCAKLKTSDRFAKEFVMDRPIKPMFDFANITTTDTLVGFVPGTGHPVFTEVGTSDIGGLLLNATNEGYSWLWPIPMDLDPGQAIKFRVKFSNSEALNAAITAGWTFAYTLIVPGTTALAAPATSLTITTAQGALGANIVQNSNWATMAADTLAACVPGDSVLNMNVKLTLTGMADATLLSGEVEFGRRFVA